MHAREGVLCGGPRMLASDCLCTGALKCAGVQPYVMDKSKYNPSGNGHMDLSAAGDC
ncbi:MAG: hypothetical protein ACPIOQ_83540 [Promethearchaeia archaeon]